jgi:hypothetical protein
VTTANDGFGSSSASVGVTWPTAQLTHRRAGAPVERRQSVHVVSIRGGHIVAASGKRTTLTNFVINTQTKHLTATIAGKSLPNFAPHLASPKRASHYTEPSSRRTSSSR